MVADAFGSAVEADLVEAIRASPEYRPALSLVATLDDEVVGHVMLSGARLRHGESTRPILMLSPLAVAPSHQRHGVGSALVRAAVALADEDGEPMVVLEGNPGYYGRLGFEPAVARGITLPLPDWAPPEAAQVMTLGAYDAADPTLHGTVEYPAAFDGL